MISLELAKRLRELGVERSQYRLGDICWEPKIGNRDYQDYLTHPDFLWLPTLSQLLEEVEKRGWAWDISSPDIYGFEHNYECCLYIRASEEPSVYYQDRCKVVTHAPTPEDAVALALISILESSG